jgi:glutathione S-transferase
VIKLYGFPGTRSSRVQWLLEEAKAPYELVVVDITKGAHKQPEHVARHPHGLVPAYEDGSLRLIESTAMCLHVADSFPDAKLAPAPGTPERARYYELIAYTLSTVDDAVVPTYLQLRFTPEEKRDAALIAKNKATFETAANFFVRELGKGPFMLGAAFSAADVIVGYDLALAAQIGLLEKHPTLSEYTARLIERPAFKKAHPAR